MTKKTVYFATGAYVRSHGTTPRGRGLWAFGVGRAVLWAPSDLTLGEAKRWLRDALNANDDLPRVVAVEVLP